MKAVENSTWQNNFKRVVERNIIKTFIIDLSVIRCSERRWSSWVEKVILKMDRLASEVQCHIATEAEIDVYCSNWWIRSNLVNSDTMPTRHQPDFKKALSTVYRLKKAEDKKHYETWSHSFSSWWQWQTNWWHPYYETSPQRWSEHGSNGETYVFCEPTINLWHESQKEFGAQFTVIISVTVNAVYCHRSGV